MNNFIAGKQVTVTGGAGFIGSHLVDALLSDGAEVTVIDNLYAGRLGNLGQVMPHIRMLQIDVRDRDKFLDALKGSDIVFHLAGNASVPDSVIDPVYDFTSNTLGTYHTIEALMHGDVGVVLMASSAAVYGIPTYVPMDEGHPLEPVSPYGASKCAAERLGIAYARSKNIDFRVARIFNTYGPRQRKYVMFDLLNKLRNNPRCVEVLGDGNQLRDYSFVSDTVAALKIIMECGEPAHVYNIAGNNPTSIKDLIPILAQAFGIREKVNVQYTGQTWKGDIPTMVADITKLRNLGFQPRMPFLEGVRQLCDWMVAEVWNHN
jgi:UDP-glucose 4-epimerase